jgi:iron complex outermembrane receptor protein
MIKKFYYIFSSLLFLVQIVYAQSEKKDDKSYHTDEIVVHGYKLFGNIFTSPTKIKIIELSEIKSKNGDRLSDILELTSGSYIKSYGGNSALKTISLNGMGAEHTLILIDGNRIGTFQNSQVDLSQISKDNIEKIEILNSGFSSIYGSDAVGGVVNIITKSPELTTEAKLSLNTELGSYNQRKYSLNISKSFKNLSISLLGNLESSDDNFKYYFNDGITNILKERENSNYDYKNFNMNLNYLLSKKSSIQFNSNYIWNFHNLSGIETGTPTLLSTQKDKIFYSFLNFESVLNDKTIFRSSVSFQNYLMNYESKPLLNTFYKNLVFTNRSQVQFKNSNDIILGYEINYGKLFSNETYNNPERLQPALFMASDIKLFNYDRLNIYPSLRYDYYSDTKISNLSYKLGFNYKLFKSEEVYLKGNFGNNFRAPTFNELYWNQGGNRYLSQEKSFNIDFGIISKFKFIGNNVFELTYSYDDLRDKILWVPGGQNGLWSPVNIGKSKVYTFTAELKSKKEFFKFLKSNIDIGLNINNSLNTFNNGDNSFENQQIYVPKYVFKLSSGLNVKNINLNIFYQYISKRYTDLGNSYILPPVDLLDGNLGYEFGIDRINIVIRFEANNIMNKNYQFISGYPMPLRNYKIVLQLNY